MCLEALMLWTIFVILLILWLLGFSFHVAGSLIHLLLVIAVVVLLINLLTARRTALRSERNHEITETQLVLSHSTLCIHRNRLLSIGSSSTDRSGRKERCKGSWAGNWPGR